MPAIPVSVNYRGARYYLGMFGSKGKAEEVRKDFREVLPDEVCPCGQSFRPLLQAQKVGWMFCAEHRRWATWMRYKYDLTSEGAAALLTIKADGCFACGSTERMVLDHCHKINKVRGWLCNKCNVILGMADDDVDRLAALIAYVKEA